MDDEDRPFKDLDGGEIKDIALQAYFELDDLDTLNKCWEEISVHKTSPILERFRKDINDLRIALEAYSYLDPDKPAPEKIWMADVANCSRDSMRSIIESREENGDNGSGPRYNLFFVCLWNGVSHSLYVGKTRKDPRKRYEEHKLGIQGPNREVKDHGIGLLEPLFRDLTDLSEDEANELQAILEGDMEMKYIPTIIGD